MDKVVNNKNDLIREVAASTGISIRQAEEIINTFLGMMQQKVLAGQAISIKGFFGMRYLRARSKAVRDFENGIQKQSGDHLRPKCKFSESFVQKIKEKG